MPIRLYDDRTDRDRVLALWRQCFSYTAPYQDPAAAIDLKLAQDDGLFFVATDAAGRVVGTVVAGFDGHRGWLYSLAVDPALRRQGTGRALVNAAIAALRARGCPKVNLQVLPENSAVTAFYEKLGFVTEERISMGRRLG